MKRLALAFLVVSSPGMAAAAVVSYSDLASWSLAAGPATLVDLVPFQDPAVGYRFHPFGFTADGVTFTDPNDHYLAVMSPYGSPYTVFPAGSVLGCNECGSFGGDGIDMQLPDGTYAVSFNTRTWSTDGTVSIRLNGDSFLLSLEPGTPLSFFGITSSTPLGTIQIDGIGADYPMVGDVRYAGAVEAIPEPGSLLLLASGLACLARHRARQ
jgi:hypothetical protein